MDAFPDGFLWGASTSAYQIEGSPLEDGASPSTWHAFSHRRGKIRDGTNGDVACGHYHRWREDVETMKQLGLGAYRFSVAWTRIFPEPGRVNQRGIDFYARLIDALLDAGIEPWLTVFHLEEPLWLSGGMSRRPSVDRLVELALALMERFGDRVKNWITVNEPTIYAASGWLTGGFPPGRRLDIRGTLHSIHHLLLAHSRICALIPAHVSGGRAGLAHHFVWVDPARPGRDDEAAALMDDAANGMVLDAIFNKSYPGIILKKLGRFLPQGFERDLPEMQAGEFTGINYYTRNRYRRTFLAPYLHAIEDVDRSSPRSAMWEIHPEGLFKALVRLKDLYGNPPCFITENGFPLPESGMADPLEDDERIRYIRDHLAAAARAIRAGADCRGYFYWSLLDNFEWSLGLSMRFGLIRTDFTTLERRWKKSASWYRDLITTNGAAVT